MTRIKWILVLVAVVVVAVGLTLGWQAINRRIVRVETTQADQHHEQGVALEAQANTQHQAVEAQKPILVVNAGNTARFDAELAAMRADHANLVQYSATQDAALNAYRVRVKDLEIQIVNLTAENATQAAAATQYKQEGVALRAVISHMPAQYNWAVGGLWSRNGRKGITGEYDLERVRIGVDISIEPLNTVGKTNVDETLRILWRL
jgi:hypothetical protein